MHPNQAATVCFYNSWYLKGMETIKDLVDEKSSFLSLEVFQQK